MCVVCVCVCVCVCMCVCVCVTDLCILVALQIQYIRVTPVAQRRVLTEKGPGARALVTGDVPALRGRPAERPGDLSVST